MRRRAPIITFLALAFGLSWSYWGWMMITGRVAGPGSTASHLPGLLGPGVAALVTTALFDGRAGLATIARRAVTIPRARTRALAAIVAPPLLTLATLAVLASDFPARATFFAYPGLPASTPPLAGVLVVLALNGYGEEIGWRGWLQPTLMRHRSRITATLMLSAVWALWHLPLFAVNAGMTAMIGPALIGWAIGLTLGAFVLADLALTTDSLLAVALWHTAYNYAVATEAAQGTPAAVVSTLVMAWGAWVAIRWFRTDSLHSQQT